MAGLLQRTSRGLKSSRPPRPFWTPLYPDCSLADLYDETTMPPELRRAHQRNDRAIMEAYGFSVRDMTESKCMAELMRRYQELTERA